MIQQQEQQTQRNFILLLLDMQQGKTLRAATKEMPTSSQQYQQEREQRSLELFVASHPPRPRPARLTIHCPPPPSDTEMQLSLNGNNPVLSWQQVCIELCIENSRKHLHPIYVMGHGMSPLCPRPSLRATWCTN